MSDKPQSPGRKGNSAQPLGQRDGLVSDKATKRTAEREQRSAGPDGPDPTYVGDIAKGKPA